jgi:membrane-bound lytic murein transglycosylase D
MKRWLVGVVLLAGIGRAQEPEAVGAAAKAAAERPPWLEKAQKSFAEAVAAHDAGDAEKAHRKYSETLRTLATKTDDGDLLAVREDIAGLLDTLREETLPPPVEETATPPALDVSADDLLRLPPDVSSATAAGRYDIPVRPDDPLVRKFVSAYTGPLRARFQAALDRMALYRPMILAELSRQGLPKELLYLPLVESEYFNGAVSPAGAVGLWQFMPTTGRYAGLKINYWIDERRDPPKATRAALKVLKELHAWFDDWHLALAAYNRGLYGVQRDLEFTRSPDFASLSQRQGLPKETELYVPKMMACVLIVENAQAYGFRVKPDASAESLADEVVLHKPLDLKIAAQCAGVTESVIRELNPTLRLWCTPKNDTAFRLRIPDGKKADFEAALAKVKDWTPSSGAVKYTVKRGDVLGRIAQRYRTTSAAIQRDNRIANARRLRPGQTLVIRPGRGFHGE